MNDNLSIFGKTYTGVTAITLTDTNNQQQKFVNTTDADAVASNILNGKTAYINGEKITGNMPTQAAQTITPGTTSQTITAGKYLTGAQTIAGDSNLVAENIAEGITIFGVVGTHTGGASYPEAAGNYFGTELITFTVDFSYIILEGSSLSSYNALPGMTWGDFVDSKYNDGFRINPSDLIVLYTGGTPLHYNNSYVYQNDLIIPNDTYYVYYGNDGSSN